jgi:methyl-accepting chemotaxis protein
MNSEKKTHINLEEKIKFLRIPEDYPHVLNTFLPILERYLPTVIDEFYEHLSKFPKLSSMFRGKAHIEDIKSAQTKHWLHLFSGQIDDSYGRKAFRIGEIHEKIGISPEYYLGGYSIFIVRMIKIIISHYKSNHQMVESLISIMIPLVLLDIDITLSAYISQGKNTQSSALIKSISDELNDAVQNAFHEILQMTGDIYKDVSNMNETISNVNQRIEITLSSSEKTNKNVQNVAESSHELLSAIKEISDQTSQSSKLTFESAAHTDQATNIVKDLEQAAKKIGEVVKMISDIARQTNLLALNATIEAARAGEAGRGFTIVASEVKRLAKQTEKATDEISSHITSIQSAAQKAVGGMDAVRSAAENVSHISTIVAGAVEEQSAATNEISTNIQNAARDTTEISSTVEGISYEMEKVTESIDGLTKKSKNIGVLMSDLDKTLKNIMEKASGY